MTQKTSYINKKDISDLKKSLILLREIEKKAKNTPLEKRSKRATNSINVLLTDIALQENGLL